SIQSRENGVGGKVSADRLVYITALPDITGLEPDVRVRAGAGVRQARQDGDEAFHPLRGAGPRVRRRGRLLGGPGEGGLDGEPGAADRVGRLDPGVRDPGLNRRAGLELDPGAAGQGVHVVLLRA